MLEIWKPIEGYETFYKISNTGKVFSVRKNIVMKTYINNSGYECIKVKSQGRSRHLLVHRLVAYAFCPGYEDNLVVNHKDGNRLNNFSSNLEWCTTKENILDMKRRGTMNYTKAQSVAKLKNRKPVQVITPNNEREIFPSTKDACLKYNLDTGKASMVANGLRKHHKGYVFKFIMDDDIV